MVVLLFLEVFDRACNFNRFCMLQNNGSRLLQCLSSL